MVHIILSLLILFSWIHPLQIAPQNQSVTLSQNAVAYASGSLETFTTQENAQEHCPKDVVVWLNLKTGVYHYRGERWYGITKNGAYACEQEAIAVGDRASRNHQ